VDSTRRTSAERFVLPQQNVGLQRVIRLALVHLSSVVLLCAHSSVLAQKSADQLKADAHQAGMFQAFRVCLKQEKAEGQISVEDYRRCDLAAERLYFGLYNTDYAGPNNPISKSFVDEAQKVVNAVVGHPGLCQGDADFNEVGAAVVQDIKSYYPGHPDVSCPVAAALPCGITAKQAQNYKSQNAAGECACPLAKWNFCGTKPAPSWVEQKNSGKALSLSLPDAEVYTDYCTGNTVDGIMVLPKTCPDGSAMRLRQYVMSTCPGNGCGDGIRHTTCGDRKLNYWYLDECNKLGYYTPDTPMSGDGHVMNDEPTASALNGSPYQLQFYDFLMCSTQIMDVFQWTRTGVNASQVQWCTVPCKPGEVCNKATKTMAGAYSNLFRVNIDPTMGGSPQNISVVCNIQNAAEFLKDPGVNAILTAAGCGHAP
jgi:hypothetical protein